MNNTDFQSIQGYLDTLNGKKEEYSYKEEKKSSFVKDFFAVIIVLGILCIFFSDGTTLKQQNESDPLPSTSTGDIEGKGNYVCDSKESDEADKLRPTIIPNEQLRIGLDAEALRLTNELKTINQESANLKSNPGNPNAKQIGEQLTSRLKKYNQDVVSYNQRSQVYQKEVNSYTLQLQAYNNYLYNNCEKIRSEAVTE